MYRTLLVFVLLMAPAATAHAQAGRGHSTIHGFHVLDVNVLTVGLSSYTEDVIYGVGVTWDASLGRALLIHARLLGSYLNHYGLKADLGLGIVLHGTGTRGRFSTIFWDDNYSYYRSGGAPANIIHSLDIGVRQFVLFTETDTRGHTTYESWWDRNRSQGYDSILYAGYRFDYLLAPIASLQQVTVAVHGMAGFINRFHDIRRDIAGEPEDEILDDSAEQRFAWGVMGRVKWWLFEFQGGYFDGALFMETCLNIPLSFW